MGGYVALGFRFADGEVVCYETYTNHLPLWLKSKEVLVDQDESYIKDYIAKALVEYPDDSFTVVPLAPSNYGLVFYDFKALKIHNRQSYFGPMNFFDVDVISSEVSRERILKFAEVGAISVAYWDPKKNTYANPMRLNNREEGISFANLLQDQTQAYYREAFSGKNVSRASCSCRLYVDSKMRFIDHENDEWLAYMDDLIDDGIDIPKEAQEIWEGWNARDLEDADA